MLDTGIDVPEIVNLVFFKPVRSKTKFWQMIGRGTRLCPDLFGPGRDKEFFYIFDWCRNFEFFSENPDVTEGAGADSLAKRLFAARVEAGRRTRQQTSGPGAGRTLRPTADCCQPPGEPHSDADRAAEIKKLRDDLGGRLRPEIAGMSLDNFLVRPHRRYVEKYSAGEAWARIDADARHELIEHIAGLPSAVVDDDLAAKQFDLVVFRAELALLRVDPAFQGVRTRITEIASLLEELGKRADGGRGNGTDPRNSD